MVLGLRVVRGPDWNLGNEDGGDGHLGTVVEYNGDDNVTVVWDMGSRTNCRAGQDGKCDLRILDNAPTGIRFGSSKCSECKVDGIFGMKWNCKKCEDVCLCSMCYIEGKHDEKHEFIRYFSPGSEGVTIPRRFISQKQRSFGIFPGAKIVRGADWEWGNQDGGAGNSGKVIGLRSFDDGLGDRNGVAVIWEKTKRSWKYRVGFKGKVDLKCAVDGEARGYDYYKEHLPLLDADVLMVYDDMSGKVLKVNDIVCVGVSAEKLKEAQVDHGGWSNKMFELPGRVGTIVKFTRSGDPQVEIGGDKWILNSETLVKVDDIKIGDIVLVSDDQELVELLQVDHGGWVDDMKIVLGKAGKVVRITPREDVVVAFGRKTFVFHPACLTPDPDEEIFEINNPTRVTVQSGAGLGDVLGLLMAQMLVDAVEQSSNSAPEHFLRVAARGNNDLTEKFLKSQPQLANQVISGSTALFLSSHDGHDSVVRTLLRYKANTELTGDQGSTPLLAAVVGKQISTVMILLDAGANVNFANPKGRTALHISSKAGQHEIVTTLIDRKCDVNPQDILGNTPLHDAIFEDHDEVIDLLVRHSGLDLQKQNKRGMNVLHWASYHDRPYAADKIIGQCKRLTDVQKEDGFAALHIAAVNNNIKVASHLLVKVSPLYLSTLKWLPTSLSRWAEVNAQDDEGMTPLHFVVKKGTLQQELLTALMSSMKGTQVEKIKIACLLVESGAKIDVRNSSGKTPIDICDDIAVRRAIVLCAEKKKMQTPRGRPNSASRISAVFSLRSINCLECGDNPAEVTYEPCKHRAHCMQCTSDCDKCPVCYKDIEMRKDKDGSIIIPAVNFCNPQ
ncbi:E3 ubiquitin-protein ligase MIB2-like [Argopecten irradians]|uniref:E3 ubiquitin-protein ligase MIB2-like n=1 Tax=Argopecten irradians TaxID=31199 RepID=UPI003724BD25